jgi:hypothetical protein
MESKYLNLSADQRRRRRKEGRSNFLYFRYADDFVVLCNGTKAQAIEMKKELGQVLAQIGLKLSEEKTKVTHITEGFIFLGYQIIKEIGTKGKMAPKVLIPESASKNYSQKVRRILAPNTVGESMSTKIMALNQLTRGWCEYYRCTSNPAKEFGKVSHELFWLMAHWLGRKYKLRMPRVMKNYRIGNTFGTDIMKLARPDEYKAKRLLRKTWHNPYTAKEAIVREKFIWYDSLWNGNESRQGWGDIREEVIRMKGTTCYICGTTLRPDEVEVDHATKPRARFKDKTEADRMKHLQPVCTSCHRAKTKTDLRVLSRMR